MKFVYDNNMIYGSSTDPSKTSDIYEGLCKVNKIEINLNIITIIIGLLEGNTM